MGLLTGARLNELCQLHLSDFEVVDGFYCISIKDAEEGQRLKNKSAKRLVPIHDKLIEVGLIRYVDRLRAQGHDRLFPTLELTEDGYGKMPSRWFGRFKKRCGIMEKLTRTCQEFCVLGPLGWVLINRVRKSLAEHDGELVCRLLPGPLRHLPIFLDITQGQEQQFRRGLVIGEVPSILDDLP
jgi:hypothetical protein